MIGPGGYQNVHTKQIHLSTSLKYTFFILSSKLEEDPLHFTSMDINANVEQHNDAHS